MADEVITQVPWYMTIQANFSKEEYDRRVFLAARNKQLNRWNKQASQLLEDSGHAYVEAVQNDIGRINKRALELDRTHEIRELQLEAVAAVMNISERKRLKTERQTRLARREVKKDAKTQGGLKNKRNNSESNEKDKAKEEKKTGSRVFSKENGFEDSGLAEQYYHSAHTLSVLGEHLEDQANLIAQWQDTSQTRKKRNSNRKKEKVMELVTRPGSFAKLVLKFPK